MAKKGTLRAPPIAAAEPLPGDDFYLVSGDAVTAMRDGKPVVLAGTDLERARRWVTDRAREPYRRLAATPFEESVGKLCACEACESGQHEPACAVHGPEEPAGVCDCARPT